MGVLEYLWKKERPPKGAPFAGALSFAQGFVLESTDDQDPVVYRVLGEAGDGQVKRACEVALGYM